MTDGDVTGLELARTYFTDVVDPILSTRFPGLPFAAGRLGTGSDVLGLDDAVSRDHDWGLRLSLFVPENAVGDVAETIERALPDRFRGHPTRFAFTGQATARNHVDVGSVSAFLESRLGFDPRRGVEIRDWLSLSGQAALEVVAGPVFVDRSGDLSTARRALEWYPDDVWRYLLACDWARVAQELPLMGRAADVGDETGSRVIAARVAHIVMHLAFLLERRWPPYAKWLGTVFRTLPSGARLADPVAGIVGGTTLADRQNAAADALETLLDQQNGLGLTDVRRATVPFWDRPYLHPDPEIVRQLVAPIADPEVSALRPGPGSVEQVTDNVDLLMDPHARRALASWLSTRPRP
ncbi:DUF4037 domain-containing protein [Leifsonia shinshuensis]|uniref:DUF4037 domain-containing protein n=1 Tax=Leifsonia shinshuensis TaxID=150026 RepID=UPI0021563AE9|nr:DUF4037 domain-containing protein [Leifsonia shinshuensis]